MLLEIYFLKFELYNIKQIHPFVYTRPMTQEPLPFKVDNIISTGAANDRLFRNYLKAIYEAESDDEYVSDADKRKEIIDTFIKTPDGQDHFLIFTKEKKVYLRYFEYIDYFEEMVELTFKPTKDMMAQLYTIDLGLYYDDTEFLKFYLEGYIACYRKLYPTVELAKTILRYSDTTL